MQRALDPPIAPARRAGWAIAASLFTLQVVAATSPLWTATREPQWDARDMGYPAFAYLGDSLRQGRFPFWDPYTNCGYPFAADPVLGATSPVAVAFAAAIPSASLGFALYWIFHWMVGGLGMLVLVAVLGGSPAGGLAAAVLYAFSGFQLGHGQHTAFLVTAAWIPWAFAFAHAAVARRRWAFAPLSGVALALSALGGYPALSALAGFALALWLALAFLTPLGPGTDAARPVRERALWVAGALGAAALLFAIGYAPALYAFFRDGAAYTGRTMALETSAALRDNPFTVRAWLSLFFPAATVSEPLQWLGTDVSMANGYVGALGIPLAAVWIVRPRGERSAAWIAVFALVFLAASPGAALGVRWLLQYAMPVTRFLHHNGAFRLFFIIGVTAAAGCGISALGRDDAERRRALVALGVWAALSAIAAGVLVAIWRGHGASDVTSLAARVFWPSSFVLALGAALVGAWPRGAGRSRTLAAALAAACAVDGGLHLWTNQLTVWAEDGVVARMEALPKVRRPEMTRWAVAPFGPTNVHQVIQTPLVEGYVTMLSDFNRVLAKSRFAEVLARERFWVAPGAAGAPSQTVLAVLAGTGGGDPVPAFADGAAPGMPPAVVPGTWGSARIVDYAPERIDLDVNVPGDGGFLASTERFTKAWRVTVDGSPAVPVRTNLFFRGVALPGGRHAVTWRYDPGAFWPLSALALAVLTAATCISAAALLRRRHTGAA